MNRRGLSPVLGLVLLVGITAIASVALFVVGLSLSASTQASIEHQQAERSLVQLADSGDRIATSESDRATFEIQGAESGTVRAISNRGSINITVVNRSNDTRLFSMQKPLGAVIYEASDGTKFAYQGGGVWRKDPSGRSTMVRPPEFHYRAGDDPTITYPVVLVRDDFTQSGSTSGALVQTASDRHYPDRPSHYNPLRHGSVLIRIQSRYCEAWEEYYEGRTDGSAAESCEAGKPGELEIQFSVPFELNGLGNGVMLGGSYSDSQLDENFDVDPDTITNSTQAPSATPLVEEKLEEAKNSGRVLPDDGTIEEPGLYYDDGNLSDDADRLVFNTSEGDIEIATDQPTVFDSQADVDIVGPNNVSIYATSDAVASGGGSGEIGTYGKASQLRLFFHSDVDTIGTRGQNTDFHGLIYAPNAKVNLFRGNNNASGALVAEEYDFGNTEMEISPELQDIQLHKTIGDAPFYYLHISETVLEVEDS